MKPFKTIAVAVAMSASTILDAAADPVDDAIADIQAQWARITYQVIDDNRKEAAYEALEADAGSLVEHFPDRAEPKIWSGIVLSTHAGVAGGIGALKLVKAARRLFEEAIAIDEHALAGSAHTSLGSLYYQVPGWPLAFGDDDKAEQHLRRALAINPGGIDPNFFYGDYLYRQGRYREAAEALEHALAASPRPGRALADAGRRQEARALLDKVRGRLGS